MILILLYNLFFIWGGAMGYLGVKGLGADGIPGVMWSVSVLNGMVITP